MPDEAPTAGGRTVAVIVVSGVGDDTFGSGRDAVVAALRGDPEGRWGTEATVGETTLVATADTGDDGPDAAPLQTGLGGPNLREPFAVPTAELTGRDGAPSVRVHEMFWADLSRAQGSAQRLFYLLFAITLQVSTIGLEAIRGFPEASDPAGARSRRHLRWTMNAVSYWLAYVITPLIVAMVTLAVLVNLELLSRAKDVTSWVLLGVVGAAGVAAGWWIGERIYRGGWTFDRAGEPWAYAGTGTGSTWPTRALMMLAAALLGAALWLGIGHQDDFTVQLTALLLVATVATAIATDAAGVAPDAEVGATRTARRRVRLVIRAAVAAVPVGATLLAVLNAPREGGAGVRAANALTMIALGPFRGAWLVMLLLCLTCVLLACRVRFRAGPAGDERRRLSATVVLTIMLGPIMYALASSAMFLVFAALWRIYPDYAKTWPDGDPRCPGHTLVTPIRDGGCSTRSTVDWGFGVVEATVQPLGLALALTGVALACLAWFFRRYLTSFRHRNRYASAVDVSLDQGAAFTEALERAGGNRMFAWVFTPLVALVTVAAAVVWTVDQHTVQTIGTDYLSGIAVPLAYLIAVLAIAGVGLRNVGVAGRFGEGFLTTLGRVLDMVYDITTYLRVANPAIVPPRVRMIARYRAVLRRIAGEDVDHVVIMAHSQGTTLTLATLLGDTHRSPGFGPAPPEDLPAAPITFLSYGCPATQTYERRFPGQFASWAATPAGRSPIARWLNVFRAGDFIGRGIVAAASFDPRQVTPQPLGQERCLGPGQHTAYLSDERWRRVARHVVATPHPADLADVALGDLTVASRDESPVRPSSGA